MARTNQVSIIPTPYEETLAYVLDHGCERKDRTGTGTLSIFGARMEFDLRDSFPLITSKRVFWKGIVEELLWFLRGETNVKPLQDKGVHIWDEWADSRGDLGPIYGRQWRSWTSERVWRHKHGSASEETRTIDQISDLISQIRTNPQSRRLVVSAWNVAAISDMALPPCHLLFQFYVTNDGHLDCQLYQRSGDLFLGVPFNIASYALLTRMIARVTGLKPGRFIHVIGDAHIYMNHIEQVREQLSREPLPLPQLEIRRVTRDLVTDPAQFSAQDLHLIGYDPHPAIKGEVAV